MMAINSFREVKDLLIRMQVSVRKHLKSDLNAKTSFQEMVRYHNKFI